MSASTDFPKPSRTRTPIPVPLPLPPAAAVGLLRNARDGIAEAESAIDPAAFFASGSATRAAVQAGITRVVTTRSADDLVRQTAQFVALVDRITYEART